MMKKHILVIAATLLFITTGSLWAQTLWDEAQEIVSRLDPVTFPDVTYLITDFGAIGDGSTPCKDAFDRAISICSDRGGGIVEVPSGTYYMNGPLIFKSNVNVHLAKDAILEFSTTERDYLPAVITRWEGTELFNYSPLVYAYHVDNIALTGEGCLNGNGAERFASWRNIQKAEQEMLRQMGRANVPVYQRVFGDGFHLRPGFIEPYGCNNVRIEGVTIIDSPFWVVHPIFCDNVIVRDVTIDSHNYNNDGCDPDSCTDVLIEGCIFSTGDDAIAIKSGRDNDAWRIGRPTENVVIRDCRFTSKINGVCIGSEIGGGVRNVYIENITMPLVSNAIYFKSNLDRGGYIEDIHVRKVRADSVRTAVIRFEPNYKGEHSSFNPTLFKDFTIEDVTCSQSSGCGIYLAGFPELPIQNIALSNITITSTPIPYCLDNAQNIRFENVNINGRSIPCTPVPKPLIRLNVL